MPDYPHQAVYPSTYVQGGTVAYPPFGQQTQVSTPTYSSPVRPGYPSGPQYVSGPTQGSVIGYPIAQ